MDNIVKTFFSTESSPSNWALNKAISLSEEKRHYASLGMSLVATFCSMLSASKNLACVVTKVSVAVIFALHLGPTITERSRTWSYLEKLCLVSTTVTTTVVDLALHVYQCVMFLTFSPLCCVMVGIFSPRACKAAHDWLGLTSPYKIIIENENEQEHDVLQEVLSFDLRNDECEKLEENTASIKEKEEKNEVLLQALAPNLVKNEGEKLEESKVSLEEKEEKSEALQQALSSNLVKDEDKKLEENKARIEEKEEKKEKSIKIEEKKVKEKIEKPFRPLPQRPNAKEKTAEKPAEKKNEQSSLDNKNPPSTSEEQTPSQKVNSEISYPPPPPPPPRFSRPPPPPPPPPPRLTSLSSNSTEKNNEKKSALEEIKAFNKEDLKLTDPPKDVPEGERVNSSSSLNTIVAHPTFDKAKKREQERPRSTQLSDWTDFTDATFADTSVEANPLPKPTVTPSKAPKQVKFQVEESAQSSEQVEKAAKDSELEEAESEKAALELRKKVMGRRLRIADTMHRKKAREELRKLERGQQEKASILDKETFMSPNGESDEEVSEDFSFS